MSLVKSIAWLSSPSSLRDVTSCSGAENSLCTRTENGARQRKRASLSRTGSGCAVPAGVVADEREVEDLGARTLDPVHDGLQVARRGEAAVEPLAVWQLDDHAARVGRALSRLVGQALRLGAPGLQARLRLLRLHLQRRHLLALPPLRVGHLIRVKVRVRDRVRVIVRVRVSG
eukprot:scaffold89836_cov42-Phaeocystis_antarctica.AAC.1